MSKIVNDKYNKPNQNKGYHTGLKNDLIQFSHQFLKKRVYIVGFIAFLCTRTVDYIASSILKIEDNSNEKLVSEFANQSVPFLIYGCVMGPILEELVFRKFIFGRIRKHSKIAAYIVSSFLFSFIHFLANLKEFFNEIAVFPVYFIIALILAFAYDYDSYILASMIGHILQNSSNLLFFYKL